MGNVIAPDQQVHLQQQRYTTKFHKHFPLQGLKTLEDIAV